MQRGAGREVCFERDGGRTALASDGRDVDARGAENMVRRLPSPSNHLLAVPARHVSPQSLSLYWHHYGIKPNRIPFVQRPLLHPMP